VRREFESAALGGELAKLFVDELAPASVQPSATPVAART
jgi:hypothetical protein